MAVAKQEQSLNGAIGAINSNMVHPVLLGILYNELEKSRANENVP